MDATEFLDAVRDDHETPLSRLGSSKWIYALTGGGMDGEHVRAAAADEAHVAARTFDAWAADELDADAAGLFEECADVAREEYDRLADDDHQPADSIPLYDTLDSLEGTDARLGGLLGRTLVTEKTLAQMVGFFVGDADPTTAGTFRDLRGEVEDQRAAVVDALDARDPDWDAARKGADAAVEAAYDDYVTTLESMGVKPKNVC